MSLDTLYAILLVIIIIVMTLTYFLIIRALFIICILLNCLNILVLSIVFPRLSDSIEQRLGWLILLLYSILGSPDRRIPEELQDSRNPTTVSFVRLMTLVATMHLVGAEPADIFLHLHSNIAWFVGFILAECLNIMFIYLIARQHPNWWDTFVAYFENPSWAGAHHLSEDINVGQVPSRHSTPRTIDPRLLSLSNSNSRREAHTSFELDWNDDSNPDSGSTLEDEGVVQPAEFPFSSVRDFYLDGVYDHLPSPDDFSMTAAQTAIPETLNLSSSRAALIPARDLVPVPQSIFDRDRPHQVRVSQISLLDGASESSNVDQELSSRPQILPRTQEISSDNTQQLDAANASNTLLTLSTPIGTSCPHCSKEFLGKSSRSHHILSHTKPFQCPYSLCSARFATITHLSRHKNVSHAILKKYYCKVENCKYAQGSKGGKFFKRLDHAKRHAMMKHKAKEGDADVLILLHQQIE